MRRALSNDEPRARRWRIALFVGLALAALVPLALYALLRFAVIAPAEFSITIRPLRIATTCYSGKRFCLPMENANPPPSELFILIDWPDSARIEEILLTLPLH